MQHRNCAAAIAALVFLPLIGIAAVQVEFFFTPGCSDCGEMRRDVLPLADSRYGDLIQVTDRSIDVVSNLVALVALQDRLGGDKSATVSLHLENDVLLSGMKQIRSRFFDEVDYLLTRPPAEEEDEIPVLPSEPDPTGLLERRIRTFTLPAVIFAGLGDGINPCAFATVIFLATMLMTGHRPKSSILKLGISFCAATYVTYLCRACPKTAGFGALALTVFA